MSPAAQERSNERYRIRSVERALSILQLFAAEKGELSASEISRKLGLPQSTAFRLLVTLAASGFVEQNPENDRYRLGVGCLALGSTFLANSDLRQRSIPYLERLRDETGETVHLGILDGYDVVYLDQLPGLHPIGLMSSKVGAHAPSYCTGLGKALLAFLPEEQINAYIQKVTLVPFTPNTITNPSELLSELSRVCEQGYSFDNEEHEQGVGCIAAPVFDHKGVVAAISIAGPAERIIAGRAGDSEGRLVQLVTQTAAEISVQLGAKSASRVRQSG